MNDIPRGLGDNRPPVSLIEDLQLRYKDMLDMFAELTDAASQAPERITDDATHAKVLELIKQMRVLEKQADGTREIEREPFKQKVDEVNGFFKSRIDPLKKQREALNERHEAYSKAKADAEKRRLEEEAERRREQAARDLAAAQEAERKKREAEAAQAKAEADARAAEVARQLAIEVQRAAEARAIAAKAEEARLKAEQLQRQADEARRAKKNEAREAEEAERRAKEKAAHDAAVAAARAQREIEDAAAAKAKQAAAQALRKQREAEEASRVAKAEVKVAGRDEAAAMTSALREEKRADRLQGVADGPDADLGRSRSEHGAVGTLTRRWQCRVVDRDKLDKEALWPFINGEAVEAALWKWMMAQGQNYRVMAGAVMEEETVGAVR